MCGRATLAIVVSRICMIIATITETVMRPRCLTSCGAGATCAVIALTGFSAAAAEPAAALRCRPRPRRSGPMRSGRSSAGSQKRTRTGTRCTTLTQLPVAFCAGSTENSAPVPAPMLATTPSIGAAGIGVDRDRRLLAGNHLGEVGLLEVGLDPAVVGLDQAEERRRHGLRAGHVAADLKPVGLRDDAVDRRVRLGMGEVERRLVALGDAQRARPGAGRS